VCRRKNGDSVRCTAKSRPSRDLNEVIVLVGADLGTTLDFIHPRVVEDEAPLPRSRALFRHVLVCQVLQKYSPDTTVPERQS
jgi:hypothetical protein